MVHKSARSLDPRQPCPARRMRENWCRGWRWTQCRRTRSSWHRHLRQYSCQFPCQYPRLSPRQAWVSGVAGNWRRFHRAIPSVQATIGRSGNEASGQGHDLWRLVISDPKAMVVDAARPYRPIAVSPLPDREEVARILSKYDLAVPGRSRTRHRYRGRRHRCHHRKALKTCSGLRTFSVGDADDKRDAVLPSGARKGDRAHSIHSTHHELRWQIWFAGSFAP